LPNIKSAKKRVKTNRRDELRNRAARSTMRSAIKATSEAVASKDEKAGESVRSTQALIARTAKRGVIHKKKAARLQSRMVKAANKAKAQA
jgi:small subunit ribosomal protein S20